MNNDNQISSITRKNIFDELQISKIWYNGRLDELDFLLRIFKDLKSYPSNDERYKNAYDDIIAHTFYNPGDWDPFWIFDDPRFKLLECEDELILKFLAETIHPFVRNNNEEVAKMVEIYNRHLKEDGFEIFQESQLSGKPIFSSRKNLLGKSHLDSNKTKIKKYLNSKYIATKIDSMNEAINSNTDVAIGSAKELIETICKSILKQNSVKYDKSWNIGKLMKETTKTLNFAPKSADNPNEAEGSVRKILGGISSIVQGVSELRNAYGTGHGKEADFKALEPKYAALIVGVVGDIAYFYLKTNGENTELVE